MAAASAPGLAAGVLGAFCLVLWFDVISCEQLSSAQSVFGVVNKSVTFLTASSIPVKDILWKKRKDKVVEKEENLDESIYPPFRERILLNIVTGDLTIFNLSSSDEDEYEFESTSIKDSIKFFLTVFDHSRHRYVLLAVPLLVIVLIVILLGAFQRWRAE
uniref:CD58 molecule n=1 Tax=Equus asinus TaxID=9793 RepID=A0A9L0JM46_EQUAS